MKRFVLFVMLMMSVAAVNAQRWSLTPEVGMTAVKRGGPSYYNELGWAWNARWKIGVGAEFFVKPERFSLKSGLYYTQRGHWAHSLLFGNMSPLQEEQSDVVFSEINGKTNRHFLQVPLMANFSFRLADHVRLNLAAGPYFAWSMGDKNSFGYMAYEKTDEEDVYWGYGNVYVAGWKGNGFSDDEWTHDNPFDWGLLLQAGLEIGSCVMNVGYDASLGKEYEYDSAGLKYHTFSLSIGYKFKLGK